MVFLYTMLGGAPARRARKHPAKLRGDAAVARSLRWPRAVPAALLAACVFGGGADPARAQISPLAVAAANDSDLDEVRRLLAEGADPNHDGGLGLTPVHEAAKHGAAGNLAALLAAGGDPDAPDWVGNTPLHLAAETSPVLFERQSVAVMRVLLEGLHAPDPNADNEKGETPLHLAAGSHDSSAGVMVLLDAGADPNRADGNGATPLHAAVGAAGNKSSPNIVGALLAAGADAGAVDGDGLTPLLRFLRDGPNRGRIVNLLLDAGADPDGKNPAGDAPLHAAIRAGGSESNAASETVEALLAGGADPCIRDARGFTPYQIAPEGGAAHTALDRADGHDLVCDRDENALAEAEEEALGLDSAQRRRIQQRLAEEGFDPGSADGMFGPRTRSALSAWQEGRDLDPTGYLTREQADALVAAGGAAERDRAEQERAEQERAERGKDDAAFASARRADTASAYEEYLSSYPSGLHAVEARGLRDAAAARERISAVGDVFRDCPDCPEMVVVPAGNFMMGSPPSEEGRYDREGPVHRVAFAAPFAVGVFEVTFAEWDACVSAGGCGGYRPDDAGWGRGSRPVVNVSWDDAQSYVGWLSRSTGEDYRLLSESEWEYVARAGTSTRYWWGDDIGRGRANCASCGSQWDDESMAPVGSFVANAFGLHDVHGNVWEWTGDCWNESYAGAPEDGRAWEGGECSLRVLRGGSWLDDPQDLRSALRGWNDTGDRYDVIGFRVARTLTP